MNEFGLLFKLIFKNTYRSDISTEKSKKKKVAMIILLCVAFVPLLVMICGAVFMITRYFAEQGAHFEVLSLLVSASQMMILFFGMQVVLSQIYMSKDNEFLAQLPVPPKTLFTVKLSFAYLNEIMLASVILVPSLIAFIAGVAASSISLPWFFYLLLPVIIFLSPMVPLFIINLLAFPVMRIIRALKNKTTLAIILMTLLFVGLMALYMIGLPNAMDKFVDSETEQFVVTEAMQGGLFKTSRLFFYNRALAQAACGIGFWKNIGIFLATLIGTGGLGILLSTVLYAKSVNSQMETPVKQGSKEILMDTESVEKALLKREVKSLFGDMTFAFNSIMGSIMGPLFILIMGVAFNPGAPAEGDAEQMSAFASEMSSVGMSLFYLVMMTCGMNISAVAAFTREGQTFYINKYLPVTAHQIIIAKLQLADIIGFAGVIPAVIITIIVYDIGFLSVLALAVTVILLAKGFNYLGVLRDLKKPNLNWINYNEAIKKNFNTAVPMFYAMGAGIVIMMASMFLPMLETVMYEWAISLIFWGCCIVGSVVFMLINRHRLMKDGPRLFDEIDESSKVEKNKFVSKGDKFLKV